jgi:hypothetical protein
VCSERAEGAPVELRVVQEPTAPLVKMLGLGELLGLELVLGFVP